MSPNIASRLISMAGVIAGSLLWSAAANAQTISVGLEGVQLGASWSGADPLGGSVSGTNGVFSARVTATGFPGLGGGFPIPLLDGNAITVNASRSGTVHLAITEPEYCGHTVHRRHIPKHLYREWSYRRVDGNRADLLRRRERAVCSHNSVGYWVYCDVAVRRRPERQWPHNPEWRPAHRVFGD